MFTPVTASFYWTTSQTFPERLGPKRAVLIPDLFHLALKMETKLYISMPGLLSGLSSVPLAPRPVQNGKLQTPRGKLKQRRR